MNKEITKKFFFSLPAMPKNGKDIIFTVILGLKGLLRKCNCKYTILPLE